MIIEPWKSADEIERRLSALNDPELVELLKTVNRGLLGTETESESYSSPSAPYWNKRIAAIALAGLLAMSAGAGYVVSQAGGHHSAQAKPHAAAAAAVLRPRRQHRIVAVHNHPALPLRAAALVVPAAPAIAAPPVRIAAPAPNEALVRQARAELLHERALVAQEKMQLRAQAAAASWAQAEAVARARAQAQAEAQAEATARRTQEEQAAQTGTAGDPQTQDSSTQPPDTGRIATNPSAGYPIPMPGPIDTNCTPSRGGLFGAVLGHIRVGGTTVGGLLRLIH